MKIYNDVEERYHFNGVVTDNPGKDTLHNIINRNDNSYQENTLDYIQLVMALGYLSDLNLKSYEKSKKIRQVNEVFNQKEESKVCDDDGVRNSKGKCICDKGYSGVFCENIKSDFSIVEELKAKTTEVLFNPANKSQWFNFPLLQAGAKLDDMFTFTQRKELLNRIYNNTVKWERYFYTGSAYKLSLILWSDDFDDLKVKQRALFDSALELQPYNVIKLISVPAKEIFIGKFKFFLENLSTDDNNENSNSGFGNKYKHQEEK
jgi:hypothetical protein